MFALRRTLYHFRFALLCAFHSIILSFLAQTHHPEHYEYLLSKWRKFYPESMLSSGTRSDQPYVPPSAPPSSSSLKNPMNPNSSSSSQKKFQKNVYSSLPVADDEEEGGHVMEGESDEEESIQLNSLPLSLSQIMSISKTTVNSAMNIAIQSKNTINEFISSNTQSQSNNNSSSGGNSNTTVNRGTYGPSPSSNNDETSSSYDNSML
jgi:hypothetical protein